jgi:predicted aminopeptidase
MARRPWVAVVSIASLLTAGTALLALTLCSGCTSLGYYAQSVGGHLDLMRRARPVDDWVADPATPAALRERLRLARELRQFAVTDLKLPDNPSYRRYADLGRSAVVWNVVAAPQLSLTLHTWCYPVMGCVGYRGYFQRDDAMAEAATLRSAGLDVFVYGVPAYSTLGWSNWMGGDPLLNTFVRGSSAALARLVFHELSHQVVYVADDTTFNESFATAVERLGLARWQATHGGADDDPAAQRRRLDFMALTLRTRDALAALYRADLPDDAKRQRKAEILAAMRAEHAALKAGPWAGDNRYDDWLARADNAALAVQAAYDGLVPDFERLFHRAGDDFGRFYVAVQQLAALPKAQRLEQLQDRP